MESLRPWLDQVVIIGGWAHRLYRLHPLAERPQYEPLATLDADVALPRRLRVAGDEIYQRLRANGFKPEFLGHHRPPAAHYRLTDPGAQFYAEFLTPLCRQCSHQTREAESNTEHRRHLFAKLAVR